MKNPILNTQMKKVLLNKQIIGTKNVLKNLFNNFFVKKLKIRKKNLNNTQSRI